MQLYTEVYYITTLSIVTVKPVYLGYLVTDQWCPDVYMIRDTLGPLPSVQIIQVP